MDELSLAKATVMTSLYPSATEIVESMATTAISNEPPNTPQLTAAANNADETNIHAGSVTNSFAVPQEHKENTGELREVKDEGLVQKDMNQQIKVEEQRASPDGRADMDTKTSDLSIMADGKVEGRHNEIVDDMQASADAVQSMVGNGQLPGLYHGLPDPQNPTPALAENEQSLGIYDPNVAELADGTQSVMENAQQSSGLFGGLPLNEAQALMEFQMMERMGYTQDYLDPPPEQDIEATRIQAYAKLEFEDGEFYMNTFGVYLGRDIQAARAAMRRDKEEEKARIETEASIREPGTPVRVKREESKYSKSIVSESGGILREGGDSDSDGPTRKKKSRKASKKSKSTGSSSQHVSRRNSIVQDDGPVNYQPQVPSRHAGPETVGAASVDLASLRPSPYECPLIGIHPPASASAAVYKSISRKHVKIAYNSSKRLFEAEILGRNGAFIDDEFCHYSEIKELKSGSYLQIGSVRVRFVLPDVVAGQTGAEQRGDYEDNIVADRYSEGGKEMSFDFEDGHRDGVNLQDTSEESSEDEGVSYQQENAIEREEMDVEEDSDDVDEQDEGEEEEGDDEDPQNGGQLSFTEGGDENEVIEGVEEENNSPGSAAKRDKKRGPGRPPKDGIMSKREKQLAKKEALAQQKQKAQKSIEQPSAPSTTGKNKVGRPRKHPRPNTPPVQKEKRKYTKRKPKEPKDPNVKEEDQPPKEKKEKKPAKPPRSPSPEMKESDYTAEQLQKPAANYVILIHEALSNSPTGQLNLQDIYRAIQRKHPYYKFKCATIGWQSSVRHNVQQHAAFQKGEKDGKGHFWSLVDGVSIEKEKKRRTTPPPQGHPHYPQPIYQAGYPPHMMPGHHYGPPPYQVGYPMPPNGYHVPYPQSTGPHPQGVHLPPPQINGHLPPPFPVPPQLAPPNTSTYSSPYAPKPVVSVTPQPNEPRQNEPQNPVQTPLSTVPPQSSAPQPVPEPTQLGTTRPDEKILQFIEHLKPALVNLLTERKSDKPEAVFQSVVNRVLGITTSSTVNDDPHEELLIKILKQQLIAQYGGDFKPSISVSSSCQQNSPQQPQPQSPANQVGTQGNATQPPPKTAGSERSAPTVMRPSFTGRPSGPSIPRPPMKTPGLQRANSGSPAQVPSRQSVPPSSASPAPAAASPTAATTNGASTPKLTQNGSTPPAGHKWPCEQSEDKPEAKRLNGNSQHAGLKRQLEDMDDNRDFKRHAAAGPPQLKT
jgi:hypothetical protein